MLVDNQRVHSFFLPAQHAGREVLQAWIEKLPRRAETNSNIRRTQRTGNVLVAIEQTFATVRKQGHASFETGRVDHRCKQEIDINAGTNSALERVRRLLVLFEFFEIVLGEAQTLVAGIFDVVAAEVEDLVDLTFRRVDAS